MQVPRRVRERDAASGDDRSYSYGRITPETVGSPSPAKDVINGGDNTTATDKEIKKVPPNNKNDNRIAVKRRPPDPGPVAACHSPGKKSKQLEENATDSHKAQNNKAKDCEDKSTQLTVRSKGKDRHSKVKTAKGLRDRRVRLSAPTAIQFFDVQDRLGFDQPSKAVDWLLKKAKEAIDELTLLQQQQQQHLLKIETVQTVEEKKDKEDAKDTTHINEQITTPTSEKEILLKSPVKSPVNKLENQKNSSADAGDQEKDRAGSRAKARERARERANLNKGKDSFAAKAAANTAKEGLSKCKDEHGINLVVDAPNVEAPTKDIEVVSSIMQAQYACPLPLLMQQQQLDISNDNTSTATNTIGHVTPYSELNHHLLLKQQQAMQASLFSYLLSNAPYDASAMASQGNNSNSNRPWQEVRPMINDDNCDGAAALAFHQSKRSLLIPALQGVAGCPANPNACCNGKSNIEEREKANAMYSHMLVGHYEADSTMTQTALISPYNQSPPPILPPPAHQGSQKNNEKMAVQRMMMASNNSTSSTSSFEQQVSPGHGSTLWSNYNSIGLPYNHPSSSTGGTLQSIFSPVYSSSNSHQQLLIFTTSGGQTPSSSLSSASSGVFNMNMSTCTTTPSTWVHAGSMADDQMEGADTGLPPPHAANSWSHR